MAAPGQWSTGLCDCGEDCSNCCLTFWCPCITFGRIAEVLDKGTTCKRPCSCMYRSKLRKQYMLSEKPCNDCLVHCCCESCALCQEYRELKHRGFEPSLGWEGNLARQNQGIVMPPVGAGEMKR
ncbi:hypothetical protein E3N88_19786 [Mikania micrantha]|uniref:Uncharacterized protein n=1 Tax=Mikania micrantha TaxID=192012 RepID=A0A5N6NQU8_9ASTR|nr:hypothetical protein E3N88_19786 [Mikania micrantha]